MTDRDPDRPSAPSAENQEANTPSSDSEHEPASHPTVVGIGASAGGLAALREFFGRIPPDTGLAYVVVVHLSPEHESHLPQLLQPHMSIPVEQVSETVQMERDHAYVIPPNANLEAVDTHLRVSRLESHRKERAPIDHFFRTLSRTHEGHAIGVILTGTGSDGTLGLKEIKAKGGLAVVQDPKDAEYDGMPQSAIATGQVDRVLPLADIPEAIINYERTRPKLPLALDEDEPVEEGRRFLEEVFVRLRARTGRDFTHYKRSTVVRRIMRRMQLAQVENASAYLDVLRDRPQEAGALADDLLITVTNFFRDPEVFEALERDVIPLLFEGKGPDDELRTWSVGCATGEEAYSLAILLVEEAARREMSPRIQVFASDLHEDSLEKARLGFYPGDIQADIRPERLHRFFRRQDGGYRIRDELRELVIFAPHNLLADPPFSRLDMVVCRNLLIYLRRDAQRDVLDLLHYALNPDGFLLLGTSERADPSDLFRVQDKKHCIYRKRNVPAPEPRLPVFPLTPSRLPPQSPRRERRGKPLLHGSLHQHLVERYGPPSLLLSPEDNALHLSEHAGRYLVHPGGELTANVYKLVREELRVELQAALRTVREEGRGCRTRPIPVHFNGETAQVILDVRPSRDPEEEGFVLVMFDEREDLPRPEGESPRSPGETPDEAAVRVLEQERDEARRRLRAVIEEYETNREEMKASNEELQSVNEELRSTLEELETSKEELQSMNEELQTVNQENRHKVAELARFSTDLQNLLAATGIATLFLDRDLRILRFTPKVNELFSIRPTDQGRPLADMASRLGDSHLLKSAREVLETLVPVERESRDELGRWYLTRILPYRSNEDRIEGVVITFIDITGRREAEQSLLEAKTYAERIIETLHEPLVILTPDLRIHSVNRAFCEHFQVRPAEAEGHSIYELGNGEWDIPALRHLLEEVLPRDKELNDFEVVHEFRDIGHRVMLLNGRRLDSVDLLLLGIRDITERKEAEAALLGWSQTLEERVEERTHEVRDLAATLTLAEQEERRKISELLHDDLQQLLYGVQMKMELARKDGEEGKLEAARSHVGASLGLVRDAITMTRRLTVDLSPPVLEGQGLAEALRWLGEEMREMHGLNVEVRCEQPVVVKARERRILLFGAARELLFNVAKHAATDRAVVELEERDGAVRITVSDDGLGFDPEILDAPPSQLIGLGLARLRDRLRLYGANAEFHSAAGAGTRVVVQVPVSDSSDDASGPREGET